MEGYIMSFNIYVVDDYNESDLEDTSRFELTEDNKVESGLSAGEVRQSLLDRLRSELDTENPENINNNLKDYSSLHFTVSSITSYDGINRGYEELDNCIYELYDDEISHVWVFDNEIIYVENIND